MSLGNRKGAVGVHASGYVVTCPDDKPRLFRTWRDAMHHTKRLAEVAGQIGKCRIREAGPADFRGFDKGKGKRKLRRKALGCGCGG